MFLSYLTSKFGTQEKKKAKFKVETQEERNTNKSKTSNNLVYSSMNGTTT